MYEKELVSVVVPSFNHGKYIDKTIKSVMNQTYENIELIVIDDKSSDNSIDIIKSVESDIKNRFDNYQFIFKDTNLGLTDPLNKGLYLAKGKYFTYIQSDDVMHKDKIYLSVETFKKLSEDYSFIFSDVFFIDEEDSLTLLCPIIENHRIVYFFCIHFIPFL
jgi:Glycosyltransferases involved in cell wall biogenesis